MANIDAIRQRLDQALARIEKALENNLEAGRRAAKSVSTQSADMQALKAQCDRLKGELETIRGEYASLKQLTDTVSGRLDRAIDELQIALEG
jgi:prefoldin subunit 5